MVNTKLEETGASAPAAGEPTRSRTCFSPRCDIYESKEGLVLLADMPGAAEDSVEVLFENGILTVTGHVGDPGVNDHELRTHEYRVGDYRRQFALSEAVDAAKIEASVASGVLRLELPKTEATKPRKIAVTQR